MLPLLAESERAANLPEGYEQWLLITVMACAVAFVVFVIMISITRIWRRWMRRELDGIDKDKAQRRAQREVEGVDAWSESAQRYVDHDKLPDPPEGQDEEEDDNDGWGEPSEQDMEEEADPYGLFKDKPYRDPDDDDDEEDDEGDEDSDGWDDEDDGDDDGDEDRKPRS